MGFNSPIHLPYIDLIHRPRGLMDKASDFGSEDCEFESRRGQNGKFSSSNKRNKQGLVDRKKVHCTMGKTIML